MERPMVAVVLEKALLVVTLVEVLEVAVLEEIPVVQRAAQVVVPAEVPVGVRVVVPVVAALEEGKSKRHDQ